MIKKEQGGGDAGTTVQIPEGLHKLVALLILLER
jgi:hypothetical protein